MKRTLLRSIVFIVLFLSGIAIMPLSAGPGGDSGYVQQRPPLGLDSLGHPEHIRPGEDLFNVSMMFASTVPDDEYWDPQFAIPEADGDIYALASSGDSLYVGGVFQTIGIKPYRRLALWDGSNWQSVGDGVNGPIYAMAIIGNDLFIGGEFTEAGGVAARNIARFNRQTGQWSALGTGISGTDFATVSTIYISGDTVYVGGHFTQAGGITARSIARWSRAGGTWSSIGTGANNGVHGDVLAIAAAGDYVYVGGDFSQAGAVPANNITFWQHSTSQWATISYGQVGNGLPGYVNAITLSQYGATIAGEFDLTYRSSPVAVDSTTIKNIIELRTSTGQPYWFYQGIVYGAIRAMTRNQFGKLYIGGGFTSAMPKGTEIGGSGQTIGVRYVATTDSRAPGFSPLGTGGENGVNGYVNAVAIAGRNVYVGGSFRRGGQEVKGRIIRFNLDDQAWSSLYAGPNGTVFALEARDTSIYAGGIFATAQGRTAYGIAAWTGDRWDVVRPTVNGTIYTIDINGDDIYVGGFFTNAAGQSASNIARWNIPTRTWSSLGDATGVGGGASAFVAAIDSRGNDVYVGGEFTIADRYPANNIARWDGTRWWGVGDGVNGRVFAIAIAENGDVYVGGDFSAAGSVPVNNIARWDGSQWHALGMGTNKRVSRLTISGDELFVGGDFSAAGGDTARRIARWNMSQQQWLSLGGGVTAGFEPLINGIVQVKGKIFVGGYFDQMGGVWTRNIAMWDGTAWSPLGSGLDNQVRAMAANDDGLFAAGDFTIAGDKASHHFARWMKPVNTIIAGLPQQHSSAASLVSHVQPNPFSREAIVSFMVPSQSHVELDVFDLLGNRVASLVDNELSPGEHQAQWIADGVSEGTYCYRIRIGSHVESGTMIIAR